MYDVLIIGGGVIGGVLMRELTKYRLRVALAEKENDIATGQSRANSGIVHAGFDAAIGTKKARFNVEGNRMMPELAKELGVKYRNNGSLVVAFNAEDLATLHTLKERGEKNGVPGLKILSREELIALEPHIGREALGALHAPSGGIICPYQLTIAAIGNAMDNGAALYTAFAVSQITRSGEYYTVTSADGRSLTARIVVNCAGNGSGEVAALVGDSLKVGHRRGEYLLLDRTAGSYVSHTLFFTPSAKGKGILVSPTVDGNLLLGPTAEETPDVNVETTDSGLADVRSKAARLTDAPPLREVITSFAGTRAFLSTHDFHIAESEHAPGFYHCAGIESPGLSAAPAIAKFVTEELIGQRLSLAPNPDFNGRRTPEYFFSTLSREEQNALIARDPAYGRIVCRCERITEGEIVRAIRENPPARDIDGIKRRTRAGMGRCQGGFCQPSVAAILARELGIPLTEVTKSGGNSRLLWGETE